MYYYDRTYEEAVAKYQAACERIAEQCVEEGYPAHGSNYDLRVDAIKEFYPEIFGTSEDDEEEEYSEEDIEEGGDNWPEEDIEEEDTEECILEYIPEDYDDVPYCTEEDA